MRVVVRVFVGLREQADTGRQEVELLDGSSLNAVWPALGLGEDPGGLLYAVNKVYAERDPYLPTETRWR